MRRGFTLVEMLVAVILLSLLIGVAIFSFRMQLMSIHKTKTEGLDSFREYINLRGSLESIKFYAVDNYDVLGTPMKQIHYYFYGDKKEMNFITTNPLWSQKTSVVKLECKKDTLTYTEEPLFADIDYLRPSIHLASKTNILYKDLQDCFFSYRIASKEKQTIKDRIPDSIRILLQSKEKEMLLFVNVKSNNRALKNRVYDAMYTDE